MSRGKGMLRGQTIVDRHDCAVGLMGESQAERVVGIQIANCPTATMEVDDEWAVLGSMIHPYPKRFLG